MRAIRDPKSWLRLLSAAAGSAVIATLGCTATAQTGGGGGGESQPGDKYTFHWAVKTAPDAMRRRGDLQARVDLNGTPFQRDVAFLYAAQCGKFPQNGPHEVASSPSWMREHLAKIERHLAQHVPQRDFSGFIVIDYERWNLLWDRTRNISSNAGPNARDDDFQDDWRDYIRANRSELLRGLNSEQQEEVFISTYEAAARDFYTQTFNRVKELRPNAKVAFFGYPTKIYRAQEETGRGIIGYGDLSHDASDRNDRLAWLWQLQDFLAPNPYSRFVSVSDRRPNPEIENTPEDDAEYIRTNIAETVRLAGEKPVYAVIYYRYQRDDGHPLGRRMLERVNMANQLRIPGEAGADGVILWGGIKDEEDLREFAEYFGATLAPEAQASDAALSGGNSGDPGAPQGRSQTPSNESGTGARRGGGFTREEAREAMKRYRETVRGSQR